MKKLFLVLVFALFSITAKSQTVVATITKPGTWLVDDTGGIAKIDSVKSHDLIMEHAKRGHHVWIVYVSNGASLQMIKTNDGILFRHIISERTISEDSSTPKSTEPEK